MASKNPDPSSGKQPSFPARFIPLARTQRRAGVRGKRDPEGANVTKTGRVILNRAGSDLVIQLATPIFPDLTKCGVTWAADPVAGEVAGRLVPPSVPGITPIRRNETRSTLTLWLTDVFDEHPSLRPTSNSWVSMTRQPDSEHGDFFIIHINLALPRVTGTKSTKNTSSTKQTETKQTESKQTENKEASSQKGAAGSTGQDSTPK